VGDIAHELAERINDAALVNPVNLVALALLTTPDASAEAGALERRIAHLHALIDPARLAAPADGAACVAAALKLSAVRRIDDRIEANAHEAALLGYFRNNVLHLFALPALLASLIIQHDSLAEARLTDRVAGTLGLLRDKLFLRMTDTDLPPALVDALARLVAVGLVMRE
jgi:glycerol-3-phosphate O-acyltransferase